MQAADAQILSRCEVPSPNAQPVAGDSSACWRSSEQLAYARLYVCNLCTEIEA